LTGLAAEPTPSQTVGPFFSIGLLAAADSELVARDSPDAITIAGRILDGDGEPVPDAMVEIWQADEHGAHRTDFGWGRSGTDADGKYAFVSCKPGRVPDDDGELQAPHVSMLVFARGLLKPVRTRMYFPDDPSNAEDRVLSSLPEPDRSRLIARPGNGGLELDIRLQGDEQTTFFAV
jgi:protocatechuate 3,4-dioxygenase alpha subunit